MILYFQGTNALRGMERGAPHLPLKDLVMKMQDRFFHNPKYIPPSKEFEVDCASTFLGI